MPPSAGDVHPLILYRFRIGSRANLKHFSCLLQTFGFVSEPRLHQFQIQTPPPSDCKIGFAPIADFVS